MQKMLQDGKTPAECARALGVTEQAISSARREFSKETAKNIALENASRAVQRGLDTVEQLQKINNVMHGLIEDAVGDDKFEELVVRVAKEASELGGDEFKRQEYIRRIREELNRDRYIAVKASGEIRNQLKLQMDLYAMLYDMKAVQEFQQEVLDAIGEASPEVKNAIIRSLHEKSALRRSVKFH
jgi:transposase-like protein